MTTLLVFIAGFCFGFGFAFYSTILDRTAQALQANKEKGGTAPANPEEPEGTLAEGGEGEVTPPSHLQIVRDADQP